MAQSADGGNQNGGTRLLHSHKYHIHLSRVSYLHPVLIVWVVVYVLMSSLCQNVSASTCADTAQHQTVNAENERCTKRSTT